MSCYLQSLPRVLGRLLAVPWQSPLHVAVRLWYSKYGDVAMGFTNRPVFLFSRHPTEPHGPLLHIRVCFSLFDFSHLTFSPSVLSQDSSNFSFPEDIASFNSGLWQPRQTRFLPIVPSPQVTWQVLHGLQSPQPCSAIDDELFENYQTFTYIFEYAKA